MFTTKEDFNQKASFVCKDPYSEFEKFQKFFQENFKNYGPDSFSPTMAVFSMLKQFVGMVTCREASDRNDLFKAMSQMLFFPMSIRSSLFIVASDVNINQPDDQNIKDALVVSYVTVDHCMIFTSPYSYDEQNNLTWYPERSYISKIATRVEDDSPVGELVELFFVFSHANTSGPFQYEEVLSYFDHAGFRYEIFDLNKIDDRNAISVPFKHR
jgi:hypothetical protein